MQLLRIGRNLNQAMKAATATMMSDGENKIEVELRRMADIRLELSQQLAAVVDVMSGDVGCWAVTD